MKHAEATPGHSHKNAAGLINQLSVIQQLGEISGLIGSGAPCPDVLLRLAAVRVALARLRRTLVQQHVRTCLSEASQGADSDACEAIADALTELFRVYDPNEPVAKGTCDERVDRIP